MEICFCTPFGPYVDIPEHHRRKTRVQGELVSHTFYYSEVDMNVVSLARNTIVRSLPPTVDVSWWVDSDVLLPPNAPDLLEYVSDEHPVVSGLYFSRRYPHLPQAYFKATVHEEGKHPYLPILSIPTVPTEVDAVGAGFMLVRRDVFDRLEEAHKERLAELEAWETADSELDDLEGFEVVPDPPVLTEALHYYKSLSPWFEFLNNVGEDFYFCERLAQIGIRPLLVPSVIAEHVGYIPIGLQQFQQLQQAAIQYTHDKPQGGHRG